VTTYEGSSVTTVPDQIFHPAYSKFAGKFN